MKKKVYITAVGMDGRKTITEQARRAISESEVIIGAKRMTDMFSFTDKQVYSEYNTERIVSLIENRKAEKTAVLMSGDCGFYSGASKLSKALSGSEYETELICGVSSVSYMSSLCGIPWEKWYLVSMHGKDSAVVRAVSSHRYVYILCGNTARPQDICRKLCEYSLGGLNIYVGSDFGYETEKLVYDTAENIADMSFGDLSCMLVINEEPETNRRFGIPDCEFIRDKVPMTKAFVRSAVMSLLEVGNNDVCWDIGSGTGSVSVEMAMQAYEGSVHSVERNTDAVGLSVMNYKKFGCDNIVQYSADALEIIDTLPIPDKVFIGGSGGEIKQIIAKAIGRNPDVCIVATAVTLETLGAVSEYENAEIHQMSVSHFDKVGSSRLMRAENPVYIIKIKGK